MPTKKQLAELQIAEAEREKQLAQLNAKPISSKHTQSYTMKTKEEILKKHETDRIESHEQLDFDDYIIVEKPETIYAAMEEYAKQEAKEFALYINTHFLGVGMDEYWEEYQKEKQRMAEGMQTHLELIKAKNLGR